MIAYCTYCSKKKDLSPGELPAIQRYRSDRIKSVHNAAMSSGLEFLILSGKFGILKPSDLIRCYDHLLQPSEVSELSKRVADELETLGVKDLIFFARSFSDDEKVKPYIDCMKLACQKAGIALRFHDLPTDNA